MAILAVKHAWTPSSHRIQGEAKLWIETHPDRSAVKD
jgi:hypothetical protein